MILGGLYVVAVVVLPGGIASIPSMVRNRRNQSASPSAGPPAAVTTE
jgi:hypothetical protein